MRTRKSGEFKWPWAWLLCFIPCHVCPILVKPPGIKPGKHQNWAFCMNLGSIMGWQTPTAGMRQSDPKALSQMLAFCISTNLFTWNLTQGGQSCRLWKPTATEAFPGKAPYHETAQSSQLLSNPTKQEENQHFTGGANRSLLPGFCKGWFSTASDLQITKCWMQHKQASLI